MKLLITCPNNPKHNHFITTAHVTQDWVVDKDGDFVKCLDQCSQVDNFPEKGNQFTCKKCYAEAIVEEI
jgi:hypothetical protein